MKHLIFVIKTIIIYRFLEKVYSIILQKNLNETLCFEHDASQEEMKMISVEKLLTEFSLIIENSVNNILNKFLDKKIYITKKLMILKLLLLIKKITKSHLESFIIMLAYKVA